MSHSALRPAEAAVIDHDVARALAEDLGSSGDVTADLIGDVPLRAYLHCREHAILAGTPWFEACFRALDPDVRCVWQHADGEPIRGGTDICAIEARSRALLSAERCAINFLQTLSATATSTAACVAAVAGTKARILDTRKALPGLRLAQKYAVRCGGGFNHRIGLYDMVLIKENHIAAVGGIGAAINLARSRHGSLPIVVEVESLSQLDEALRHAPTRILLDNFTLPDLTEAVVRCGGLVPLEASGGAELPRLVDIAKTGVDYISVGALTKNIRAVDFSLRVVG